MSELIVQVSENDEVLGGIPRGIAHEDRILHREVDIFVVNNYGTLLDKKVDPPKWCHFGGHPEYDKTKNVAEGWKAAAIREFGEETGYHFQDSELEEIASYIRRTEVEGRKNHRFARIFLSRKDIPECEFEPQKSEVVEIKYFKRAELENLMQQEDQIMGGTIYILTTVVPQLFDMVPE